MIARVARRYRHACVLRGGGDQRPAQRGSSQSQARLKRGQRRAAAGHQHRDPIRLIAHQGIARRPGQRVCQRSADKWSARDHARQPHPGPGRSNHRIGVKRAERCRLHPDAAPVGAQFDRDDLRGQRGHALAHLGRRHRHADAAITCQPDQPVDQMLAITCHQRRTVMARHQRQPDHQRASSARPDQHGAAGQSRRGARHRIGLDQAVRSSQLAIRCAIAR